MARGDVLGAIRIPTLGCSGVGRWDCSGSRTFKSFMQQLEHRHSLHKLLSLALQTFCSGCTFLHQCGVLLGGMVHLADGIPDLLHT